MRETSRIIRAVYGPEVTAEPKESLVDRLLKRTRTIRIRRGDDAQMSRHFYLSGRALVGWTFVLVVIALHGVGIYYYNKIWSLAYVVQASESEIQVRLQERNDISVNLARIVLDYARHEEKIFGAVVAARSGGGDQPATADLLKKLEQLLSPHGTAGKALPKELLPSLVALAEQYPDLKLSQNFLKLSDALLETERDIATARIKHITATNDYTTLLTVFPSNLFGKLFRFEPNAFFRANDEARNFKTLDY